MGFVKITFEDSVGTIAFDRDAKRNALSAGLIAEAMAALEEFQAKGARAVVLRSATSGKVWSAGHDVGELPHADVDPLPYNDPLEQLLRAVKAFPAPVIAMVHGSVWGGACDLVLSCDLVYCEPTATFAVTPVTLGLPYSMSGLLNFMSRLPLNIVKEMFFSAEPIPAERAELVGLVNRVVPSAELEEAVYGMARTVTTRSGAAIASAKETLRVLSESTPIAPTTFEYLHNLRREVYCGPDYREGVAAFLEKRTPRF